MIIGLSNFSTVFFGPTSLIGQTYYQLNLTPAPEAIYGYTSTALHTLKKLFPTARVVNILFQSPEDKPFYQDYVMCSEYYQKNGIEWINEPLP